MGVIVLGIAVLVIADPSSSKPPPLATSCTTAGIALGQSGSDLTFAITGPADGRYVVAVDAQSVSVTTSATTLRPTTAVVAAVRTGLAGCASHGSLPSLSREPHDVELFRDGRLVAHAHLSA